MKAEEPSEPTVLHRVSAELGRDRLLIQAGGSSTSLKDGEAMWIKASVTRRRKNATDNAETLESSSKWDAEKYRQALNAR